MRPLARLLPMKPYILLLPGLFLLSCVDNDKNPESLSDTTPDSITFKERTDWPKTQLEQDNTKLYENSYTYIVDPEEVPVPVVDAETPDSPKKNKVSQRETDAPSKLDKSTSRVNYDKDAPQIQIDLNAVVADLGVNRPPLYGETCLDEDKPVQCSHEKLTKYVKDNLDYPRGAKVNDHDGTEYVTFRVTKNGTVEDVQVRSKNQPCTGCAEAAKKVIKSMPGKWVPAMRNGKIVNVTVTLPIKFDTQQFGDKLF